MGRKVLFLSETQGWSGGAAQLLALGKGLKALGWEFALLSPAEGEAAKRAVRAGLRHIPFHPRQDYDLFAARRLAGLIDAERADVLHAHHPRAHAVGLISLYLASRRPVYLVTRRVSFSIGKNPFSRLKYRNPRIDAYIAVADSIRRELVQGGVKPEKVRTIPSGVDTEAYRPGAGDREGVRRELGIPPGTALIGKIANFSEWKGQHILLQAGARLLGRGRKAVFLFAGRDTGGDAIRARAREAGLPDDALRLLGFRDDVDRLLPALDVSVNAAMRGEGISGALRESLSMEVPVVAADTGGNAELVQDGKTGRLFASGSAEDLARALEETLADPAAAKAQAAAGRRLVCDRFSVDRMVRDTDAFYRELLI